MIIDFEHNSKPGDEERFTYERPAIWDKNGAIARGAYIRHYASHAEVRSILAGASDVVVCPRDVFTELFQGG